MKPVFTSFLDFKRRYPIRPNDQSMLLGSGSYGRVIKVEDQIDTEWVAIKISEFNGNDTKSLLAEVELAQGVPRQSNIARYDACYRLETDTSVSDFAIMKYYPDGNLADLIRRVTLTPDQIYDITRGILQGLQHLHRHRIVHRDFKPANILISRDYTGRFIPKIADFGLSKLVADEELDSSDFDLSDGRGTPSYKAPEQIEGSRVSFNLDLWAFGVILYELMTGEKPFRADLRNSSEQSARLEIEKKIISVTLPDRIHQIEEPYNSMIRRCLVRDIHERVRKEDELLDLLDRIPTLLTNAQNCFAKKQYNNALGLYEQVLLTREHHAEAMQGVAQCKAILDKQKIADLLREAESLLNSNQLQQAEKKYVDVLHLDPKNAVAINELARCVELLQPKEQVAEAESTDMYVEEKTDVYVAPPAPPVPKETPKPPAGKKNRAVKPIEKTPVQPAANFTSPPVFSSAVTVSRRAFPFPWQSFSWRVVAPIAAVVGGIVLYINLNKPAKPSDIQQETTSITAGVGTPNKPVATPSPTGETKPVLVPVEPVTAKEKAETNKRVGDYQKKFQVAYKRKNYEEAARLMDEALRIDPNRRDIVQLKNAAIAALNKAKATELLLTTPPASMSVAPVGPTPSPTKPTSEEVAAKIPMPDPKEVAATAKKREAGGV